jgi:hypothetical protein
MGTQSNPRSDGDRLVREWYRLWGGGGKPPTSREIDQAIGLIDDYGLDKALEMVPVLVEIMREAWPTAARFGAVFSYIGEAVRRMDQLNRKAVARLVQDGEAVARDMSSVDRKNIWAALTPELKQKIRDYILRMNPRLRDKEAALDEECIVHLKRFLP